MPTLDELFAEEEAAALARMREEETPGTPEHAQAQALSRASAKRDADKLARSLAAGLVVGVTCNEHGDPFDLGPEDEDDEDDEDAEDAEDDVWDRESRTLAGMEGGNRGLADYDGLDLDRDDGARGGEE